MGNTGTVISGANRDNDKKTVSGAAQAGRPGGTMIGGMNTPVYQDEPVIMNKPLVGFLVSISRTPEGEYWPLRLGENVIGSGNDCSIVLNEAKVSEKHATLTIQVNEEENDQLNVWINGLNSTNGTYLNKKLTPPQTATPCQNNDKIKIGSYELLLILFDASKHGLKISTNFVHKYDSNMYGSSIPYSDLDRLSSSGAKGTRF